MWGNSSIISLIRRTPISFVPILIAFFTALANIISRQSGYSSYTTLAVLGVCSGLSIYAYWWANDMEILCVQTEPEPNFPAQDQYFKEFKLQDGFCEFNTFVYIPDWMDQFILEFDADYPLQVGLWEVPNDYNETGGTIECTENAHNFGFVLNVGGDIDELKTSDRELSIIEKRTGSKVATLTLKSIVSDSSISYKSEFKDGF